MKIFQSPTDTLSASEMHRWLLDGIAPDRILTHPVRANIYGVIMGIMHPLLALLVTLALGSVLYFSIVGRTLVVLLGGGGGAITAALVLLGAATIPACLLVYVLTNGERPPTAAEIAARRLRMARLCPGIVEVSAGGAT